MNSPDQMKPCQQCGQPMISDAPEGLCARCLLSAAIRESGAGARPTDIPTAPPPAEIAAHFPQLEILELLGRGGMGMVYKARQPQLDRIVALKILPPETGGDGAFAERFAREARTLARLNHPNIVSVYEFGERDGLFFFIMEYVDGANLRQLILSKAIAPKEALAIVPRLCEALQFAHEEGVMHRDIKPENILIDKKGRVKIADFGLAKILGLDTADLGLTQAGMSLGTPRYMAPEQIDHPEQVDHRADIYSLGVVFYEMLTGELPMGRFAPPSEKVAVDVRLDEVVLRSLERDVARRYQHVSEVKTDVENITGILDQLPPAVRQMMGVEYRSARTLFGLPLVHVAMGLDPRTGKRRVARGILAIGDNAVGVIALGGIARGGFAFGGLALGVISFGGLSLGLLSIGGVALALLVADGGLAVGPVAWGGAAAGWLAMGGAAFGVHFAGGNGADAFGREAFQQWAPAMQRIFWLTWIIFIPGMLVSVLARPWANRQNAAARVRNNVHR
jgi:predicted Ser/Thr protein kinase